LTQRAAVLAAINLNPFFKKGDHKHENQYERENWQSQRQSQPNCGAWAEGQNERESW